MPCWLHRARRQQHKEVVTRSDGSTYNGTFRDSAPLQRVARKSATKRKTVADLRKTVADVAQPPPRKVSAPQAARQGRRSSDASVQRIQNETAFQFWWRQGIAYRGGFRPPATSARDRTEALLTRLQRRLCSER